MRHAANDDFVICRNARMNLCTITKSTSTRRQVSLDMFSYSCQGSRAVSYTVIILHILQNVLLHLVCYQRYFQEVSFPLICLVV